MDFLQIALIFLIILLSIFLGLTGIQVFFILRDLKKALDKFNAILNEKSLSPASTLVTTLNKGKTLTESVKNQPKPKPKRFYKQIL